MTESTCGRLRAGSSCGISLATAVIMPNEKAATTSTNSTPSSASSRSFRIRRRLRGGASGRRRSRNAVYFTARWPPALAGSHRAPGGELELKASASRPQSCLFLERPGRFRERPPRAWRRARAKGVRFAAATHLSGPLRVLRGRRLGWHPLARTPAARLAASLSQRRPLRGRRSGSGSGEHGE